MRVSVASWMQVIPGKEEWLELSRAILQIHLRIAL